MYKIIGADGKEYGPVSAEQLRQWLTEGRINNQTRVLAEGSTDWKAFGDCPEFASAAPNTPPPFTSQSSTGISPELFERDYDLDIGGCISKGSTLLQANLGLLIGATLIYLAIQFVFGVLGMIPIIGGLFSLLNLFVSAPLMGGLFYITLQAIRSQPTSVGDVFEGFRRAFMQLCLGYIVPAIFTALCFIPAGIIAAIVLVPTLSKQHPPDLGAIMTTVGVGLVCLIPAMILSVNWMFTLPLVVDKGLDFWTAMKTSWKKVTQHWWQIFGLLLLVGLINLGGLLLCCVGLIFTIPLGIAATMYAYETIFSDTRS
jgi:uncharacterized membrane protein